MDKYSELAAFSSLSNLYLDRHRWRSGARALSAHFSFGNRHNTRGQRQSTLAPRLPSYLYVLQSRETYAAYRFYWPQSFTILPRGGKATRIVAIERRRNVGYLEVPEKSLDIAELILFPRARVRDVKFCSPPVKNLAPGKRFLPARARRHKPTTSQHHVYHHERAPVPES